jgi:hypothetical protein
VVWFTPRISKAKGFLVEQQLSNKIWCPVPRIAISFHFGRLKLELLVFYLKMGLVFIFPTGNTEGTPFLGTK